MATAAAGRPERLVVPGRHESIGDRLSYLAGVIPDAEALVTPDERVSYAELWQTATRWAGGLAAHADGDDPIAFTAHSDTDAVTMLFAIVLAGRAAIPLDPLLPQSRVADILSASGARLLDVDDLRALAPSAAALPGLDGDDPAIVFFTSGSTGTPKGLIHPHRTWLNQAYAMQECSDLTPADRSTAILPLGYGGGLDDLFRSLMIGSATLLYDPRVRGARDLLGWLDAEQVTTIHATPSLLRSMLDAVDAGQPVPETLRFVASLGEAMPLPTLTRLRSATPGVTYANLSGASEVGMMAAFVLPAEDPVPDALPLGRAVANKTITLVDADGVEVPAGVTGEIQVRSAYNSDGYLHQPEGNAARFVWHEDGTSSYRGGDLGRIDEDGLIHHKGRADAALKIGGYLVEPADVEAALLRIEYVEEAAVAPASLVERLEPAAGTSRPRLVAYVVPAVTEKPLTPAEVRRILRERLPSWMVPAEVIMLDRLPRNERGKVDRPALPPPPPAAGYAAPVGATQERLAGIWATVLDLTKVSVTDDLWQLGADSLTVEELIAQVRTGWGVDLTSGHLIDAPTIRELAEILDHRSAPGSSLPASAVLLRRGPADRVVCAFSGGGAPALALQPIAAGLAGPVAVYGFQAAGYERRALPDRSVRAVVRRHLRTIRSVAPDGPAALIGHSFGGIVALEIAAVLAAEGISVPLVALLDTAIPDDVAERAVAATGEQRLGEPIRLPVPDRAARLRVHLDQLTAGLVRHPKERRDDVFWELCHRMLARHRLTTWSGRTLVFRADDNTDHPGWWDQVLTGPHEVLPVRGGHSSILRPPFSLPIVERLDAEFSGLATVNTTVSVPGRNAS